MKLVVHSLSKASHEIDASFKFQILLCVSFVQWKRSVYLNPFPPLCVCLTPVVLLLRMAMVDNVSCVI